MLTYKESAEKLSAQPRFWSNFGSGLVTTFSALPCIYAHSYALPLSIYTCSYVPLTVRQLESYTAQRVFNYLLTGSCHWIKAV